MPWITQDLLYKHVKVYKKTWFGNQIKNGYELTSPLVYKLENNLFFLDVGYVWDGPSYPNFLEWLVGERSAEALLAASAMHDTMDRLPVMYASMGEIHFTNFNIKDGAKLYKEMITQWPENKDKPSNDQTKLQYIGLIIFQGIYALTTSCSNWKKLEVI